MKKIEYIKNNYQLLAIKLLIVILFVVTLFIGFNRTYNHWYIDWIIDSDELLDNAQFIRSLKSHFKPALIVLIATVGVFINNKIGWTIITSFIYFNISTVGFLTIYFFDFTEKLEIFQSLIFILILTIPLFIINKEMIRNGNYGISKTNMIIMNINSSIIGMGMTIFMVYLN